MAGDETFPRQGPKNGETFENVRAAFAGIEAIPGCRVGLCARGLEGPLAGACYGVEADEVLPSASLIKILVLAELLRQVDAGRVSLQRDLSVRVEDVVEGSEMVGAQRRPPAKFPGRGEENVTSASDMVALLAAIWDGAFLSPGSRAFALDLLGRQRLTSKIPFSLPSGSRFLHKTGELDGVENDAGLILLPGGTFALAVLVEGDVGSAMAPVAAAVSAVCESFSMGR